MNFSSFTSKIIKFSRHIRIKPLSIEKENVIPGLTDYYMEYISNSKWNKAFNLFKYADLELSKQNEGIYINNSKELEILINNQKHDLLQIKSMVEMEMKQTDVGISFKQLADVFGATIGSVFLAFGFEACKKYLFHYKLLKGNKVVIPKEIPHQIAPKLFEELRAVETKVLKYQFKSKYLLLAAFTHASCRYYIEDYQRLEFLGDAVIEYIETQYFYAKYPDASPGLLTTLKISGLNNNLFAYVTIKNGLHPYIRHDCQNLAIEITNYETELKKEMAPGKVVDLDKVEALFPKQLADIFEALIGAIYVDTQFNLELTEAIIKPIIFPELEIYATPEYCKQHENPITTLTHFLQSKCPGGKIPLKFKYDLKSKDHREHIFEAIFFGSIIVRERIADSNKVTKKIFWKIVLEKVKKIYEEYEKNENMKGVTIKEFIKKTKAINLLENDS